MKRIATLLGMSAVALSILFRPATADAQVPHHVDSFFVFGDSLSDTGNDFIATKQNPLINPAIPPSESPHATYFQGRFSNGPVAFEYFWCALLRQKHCGGLTPSLAAIPGVDRAVSFAFGGSGSGDFTVTPGGFAVPGLKSQVGMFAQGLQGARAPANALYAIFTGANDYLDPIPAAPADVVRNIVEAAEMLYDLGARKIMVVDLPDLGLPPISAQDPGPLSILSAEHNRLLALALKALDKDHRLKGLDVIPVTLKEFFKKMPRAINMTTSAVDTLFPPPPPGQLPVSFCLFTNPLNCPNVPTFNVSPRYFFWDAEHPTTAGHAMLALYFLDSVDVSPKCSDVLSFSCKPKP